MPYPLNKPQSGSPLFPLGQCVATPGAVNALNANGVTAIELLRRHQSGDWGDLDSQDKQANDAALQAGGRLLSSYNLNQREKVWIITEADRSITTVLLPEDY